MKKRELLILGSTLSIVTLSLTLVMLYPAIAASQHKPPKGSFSSHGSVKSAGVGVYWDQACVNTVSSIDWGVVEPGSNVNRTVYIRNQMGSAVTVTLTTLNWVPSNSSGYFGVVWDYAGQTLVVSEVVQVKFTLSVSASVQGVRDFSFDAVITAV